MDILKSSNMERVLFHLFGSNRTKNLMENLDKYKKYQLLDDELFSLKYYFNSHSSSDFEVLDLINFYAKKGIVLDPHTATGMLSICNYNEFNIICSTAEWSKFAPSICKALGLNLNELDSLNYIANRFNLPIHNNIKDLILDHKSSNLALDPSMLKESIMNWISNI